MLLNIVKKGIEKVLEGNAGASFKSADIKNFTVSYIEEGKYGHVSSNVAMLLAKNENKSPKEVAESIRLGIETNNTDNIFTKIEVAGPGFINFTFSDEFLVSSFATNNVESILENIKSQNINNLNDKNILVEYTDPNPFKVFHIGHLMTNIIGESIAGIYELAGAKVKRINYQGDVGRHIAINIYAILKPENKKIFDTVLSEVDEKSIKEKVQWLGERYAEGYADFDAADKFIKENSENTNTEEQDDVYKNNLKNSLEIFKSVTDINKYIYDRSDAPINEIYDAGRAWSLEYFEVLYKMLGTRFDKYIFESECAPIGLSTVLENTKAKGVKNNNKSGLLSFIKGLVKNKKYIFEVGDEGAIIFDGEKELDGNGKKLHKRVFVNKNGLPTYEAKDLGNMEKKIEYARENNFEIYKSVIITANEVNDYFKVIESVIEKLRPELKNNLVHFGHGMMKFADGKMSSRKGNIIAGDELIGDISDKLKEKFSDSRIEDKAEKDMLIEKVSVASIKYAVLRQAIGRDVIFDIDKVISVEGDSGPYLEYTHARLCAVAKNNSTKIEINENNKNLILTIAKYSDVLSEVVLEIAPHKLVTYLTLLCREVNSWYAHNRVVGDDTNELIAHKSKEIIAHGLSVLAMHAPERM